VHTTDAGDQIKALRRQARQRIKEAHIARKATQVVPEAKDTVERMESEAASTLAEADSLMNAARLEDLHLWKMEKEFDSRKGKKKYEYWMASWRRGAKVHNEYLGTCKKLDRETALGKARRIKAKDLGINKSSGMSD
jgi:hypothetical protein